MMYRLDAVNDVGVPAIPLLVTVFICDCSIYGNCDYNNVPPPNNGLVRLYCVCLPGYTGDGLSTRKT